jgi:LPS export ABC transporter protein LptC
MYRTLTILAMLAFAMAGCNTRQGSSTSLEGTGDSVSQPDSDIRGALVHLYTRDIMTTEIHAERIVKFEQLDSTMGYVLNIDFLDSTGGVTSILVSDSGIIREKSGPLEVYGHVVVQTSDSASLYTDYLVWDPKVSKFHTDAFVRVITPNDTVTGWGLEAPKDLSRFKILNQVSGSISTDPKSGR